MPTNPYVDEAIPHEAGHIIVGVAVGMPIRGLAVDIVRNGQETGIGHFRTLSIGPSDEAISITPPEFMAAYKLFVAGGLAGNRFAGVPAADESLQSDRKTLSRVGTESLEELADAAVKIIYGRRRIFRRLNSLIRQRFLNLMADDALKTDCYTLLSQQDLIDIFSKP